VDNFIAITQLPLICALVHRSAQKALGWFGGYGLSGTMGFFTQQMHMPAVFALLAIGAEFLGGIGLILGLLSRVAAFGIACNMVVAVLMVHGQNGLFMELDGVAEGRRY
jgi:putative oxidoreductase